MNDTHPKVQGRCPACGGTGLFLADGGYITCARADCPDPGALADLLDRPSYHVLDVRDDGWQLQHAVTCFPELLDCHVHQALVESPIIPPPGRYRVDADLSVHTLARLDGEDGR